MSEASPTNLDIKCAELGQELARIDGMEERIVNAALAVLEEQGPYAMFLYLKARHSKVACDISDKCCNFLQDIFQKQLQEKKNILEAVKALAEDLDNLLFARDLLRTALSYARYHLKAQGEGSS